MVWLPLWEVFGIGQTSAVVADVTPRGAVLADEGGKVATLQIGGLQVRVRVGVDEKATYSVGAKVQISAPDLTVRTWTGVVTSVSGFREDDHTSTAGSPGQSTGSGTSSSTPSSSDASGSDLPGYDVSIRLTSRSDELTTNRAVTVLPKAEVGKPSLAVPLTAIRQDGLGSYVLVADPAAVGGGRQVRVQVTSDADGWAAIRKGTTLRTGMRVQVTP
jgi:hypothetical protein